MQVCKKYYSTEPQEVDFLEHAEEARKKINSWVKTQTKGNIFFLLFAQKTLTYLFKPPLNLALIPLKFVHL